MIQNIPMELRGLAQWVCAGPDKVPLNPRTGQVASVTDPGTWATFDEAVRTGMPHVGFVLTDYDPYCIIDLDNKPDKPLTPEQWAVHERILNAFPAYTERSASRRGYHIVCRARLPAQGRRRDNVEVYSKERYMIFTGDVVRNAPIEDCQQLVEALIAQMPERDTTHALDEISPELSDAEIHEMALGAANGEKYAALANGDWRALGYPSQSEADFALLSILAFYSRSNSQVLRLFRCSNLGLRDKATRDDKYLGRGLAAIRERQTSMSEADLEQAQRNAQVILQELAPKPAPAPASTEAIQARAPAQVVTSTSYTLPPGLVGELAAYFHSTAVRPVQEVALSAAICFLAGVVGRSFNVSGTGLNQYMLLIAKTGTGKEGIQKGIARLVSAVRPQVPMVEDFIGPGAFASGQALIRVLDQRPCFLSVLGEFGITLQMLNDPRANAATQLLKRVLLDLYAKSGWEDMLRSTAYSDQEKNTKNVHAPAVTILGESTPETFFDGISASDIADGLIPRFHIIEYRGERPRRNRNAGCAPNAQLTRKVADVLGIALTMQNNHSCASVQLDPDGLALLDAFDEECDDHMRASNSTGETQLWNRAHLKAMKLAALLSVGVDPQRPIVTQELAQWAIEFTRKGTRTLLDRFFAGDVGTGDAKQLAELRRIVAEYFQHDKPTLKNYKCDPELQSHGLIPYAYLTVRTARIAAFYRDARGATRCLKATLETMVETEMLVKVDANTAAQKFGKRQALFYAGGAW